MRILPQPRSRLASLLALAAILASTAVVPPSTPVRAQTGGCDIPPVPIAPGQTLVGDLDPDDCESTVQTGSNYESYTFAATAGSIYTVGMGAEWLDPYVIVRDPSGTVVATDDDSGIVENARAQFTAAAAGTYSIEATSSGFGIGPYEISLAEGGCPPTATPIAPGQTLAGRLADADCFSAVQPESYYDAYALAATAGTEYTMVLTTPADEEEDEFTIDPLLVLRDPSGAIVMTDDDGGIGWNARINFTAAVDGTYTIEATNAGDWTGTYRLMVGSGSCPQPATPIALGQMLDGSISELDCFSAVRPDAFYKPYSFSAAAGAQVRVTMRSSTFDPYLVLRDPSGAVVAEDDSGAGGWNAGLVHTAAAAGTYTVEATGGTGDFTIMLAGISCPATPTAIAPGQTLPGALEATDCFSQYSTGAYADLWSFTGSPGQQYTIAVAAADPNAFMRIVVRNAAGQTVANGFGSAIFSPSDSGTYTFEVTTLDAGYTTGYTVSLSVATCPPAPRPIMPGQTLSGALDGTDCVGGTQQNSNYERWTFTAAAARTYRIKVLASGFDPNVRIVGGGGYSIFCCEPTGQRTVTFQPPGPGAVVVEVTTFGGQVLTGTYTIQLEEWACTSASGPIAVGQTVNGQLTSTDCYSTYITFPSSQHHQDTYTFDAVAGEAYVITVESAANWPYFRLMSPSGATIVERGEDFTNSLTYTYTASSTGTHSIEVSTELPLRTGPYTLSLAQGTACSSTSGSVSAGQTVSGSLESSDCYNASPFYMTGSHYDRWSIDMQAGVRYTLEMETTEVEPFLMLRGPSGAIIESGADYSPCCSGFPERYARVMFTPATSGTYTIDASSEVAEDLGAYTLAVASNEGCNGTPSPISVGAVVQGALAASDCDSTIRPFAHRDWYTFTGAAGQRVKISMLTSSFDAYLGIFGPSGALLAQDDDSGIGSDARLVVTLPSAGTYTIEATSYWSDSTGPYTLRLEPDTGGGDCIAESSPIALGDSRDGALAGTECPAVSRPGSYHDAYTFDATAGETYVISMVSQSFDSYLAVLDAGGNVVAQNDDGGYDLNALIEFTPQTGGVYKIEATSDTPDAIGSYFLSMTAPDVEPEPCTLPATPLSVGQTIGGALSAEDCLSEFQTGARRDHYTITVQQNVTYRVYMQSDDVDPWIVLIDSFGNGLMQGDDTDDGTMNAEIIFTAPETETFTVECTSANADEVGAYTILFEETVPPPTGEEKTAATARAAGDCSSRTLKVLPGRKVENSLMATDCLAPERPSSYQNRYALRAVAGTEYTIEMRSTALDARLILVGPAGTIVAENDNGAGKLDARVVLTPPADGLYTVVAVTTGVQQTGRYELTIDGRSEESVGVYVRGGANWFLRNTNTPGVADIQYVYGPAASSWTPLVGDWDGDGNDTAGLYDPATGTFLLRNANAGGLADLVFGYGPGNAGWVPIVGDWDGNGTDTVGLYEPVSGFFFLRNSNSPGAAELVFGYGPGNAGWRPIAGDWDGDGDDTVGLYVPASGWFYLRNANAAGPADLAYGFGPAGRGWAPVAGDWNGDGTVTVGLYDAGTGTFFLRDQHAPGAADRFFTYGPAGSVPLVGDWNGR